MGLERESRVVRLHCRDDAQCGKGDCMRLDEAGVDLPWLAKDRVPVKGIEATIVKPARIVQSQFRDPRTGQTRDQIVMTISFPDDTGRETVWNFACPPSSLREISLEWGQEMDDWNGGVLLISTEVIKEGLLMGKNVFVAKPVRAPPVVETVSEKRGLASAKRK